MSDLFEAARERLEATRTVTDVGCGIRPQDIIPCEIHEAVDPYAPYLQRLATEWHRTSRLVTRHMTFQELMSDGIRSEHDSVVALDVIEHMDKDEARMCIDRAVGVSQQVAVFTPLGFVEQTEDAWGMGGDSWQTHRSGWTPDDFFGWEILLDETFHGSRGAFFAIWRRP